MWIRLTEKSTSNSEKQLEILMYKKKLCTGIDGELINSFIDKNGNLIVEYKLNEDKDK